MKFNTAFVLAFGACLGNAFSTHSGGRLVRRSEENCLRAPTATIYRRFVRKPAEIKHMVKSEDKLNSVDGLHNEKKKAEDEAIKAKGEADDFKGQSRFDQAAEKYDEAAAKYREAGNETEAKKMDDEASDIKKQIVYVKALRLESEANELEKNNKHKEAATTYRLAKEEYEKINNVSVAQKMEEAATRMDAKANPQTFPAESGSLLWLWILLSVIAALIVLGGIICFIVKK